MQPAAVRRGESVGARRRPCRPTPLAHWIVVVIQWEVFEDLGTRLCRRVTQLKEAAQVEQRQGRQQGPDGSHPSGGSGQDSRNDGGRRDRDASGRARQARPRDALGRPLPYGSVGVEPVSETPLAPLAAIEAARALVRAGRAFSAHEILEARWKACPREERDLWQGLAQLCVGLTHEARGNHRGAVRLLDRGAARLGGYRLAGGPTYGLDLDAVIACARRGGCVG